MCERTEVKYFPVRTTQTKLIRNLLYGFLVVFCRFFYWDFDFGCCCLPYLITSSFCFSFSQVKRSFIVTLYNKL